MADSKKDNGDPSKSLREDSIVAKLKAGGIPAGGLASYTGLLGRGAGEGSWLLYLNLDMSRCVEIREEDIVHTEQLPPERSPFGSLGGTRVFVKKGAQVTTTTSASQTHTAEGDEFDLDIRLDAAQRQAAFPNTFGTECTGGGCATGANETCLTCVSCGGSCRATCFDTCRTQCDQQTCVSATTRATPAARSAIKPRVRGRAEPARPSVTRRRAALARRSAIRRHVRHARPGAVSRPAGRARPVAWGARTWPART